MLDEHPTGVGIFSFNITNHLFNLYRKSDYQKMDVFTPSFDLLDKGLNIKKLPRIMLSSRYGRLAALTRFIWNTFFYPLQTRKRYDVLINPTTHGSFFQNNQLLTIHDLLSLKYGNISTHQRIYFKYLLPYLIKKSKAVIAVSETTKNDVIEQLNCPAEKIHVVYNGYDEQLFNLDEDNTGIIKKTYGVENYFLAVGPTYAHKNFEFLVSVYSQLPESAREKFPLVIAGGKPTYLAVIKKLVKDLDIEQNVYFPGYVPFGMMKALYQKAYAMIFPSIYEGFGFPLIEAMACGCPVLSSNTASMPEVCGDSAVYFSPTDESSLLGAINTIISDDHLRRQMIKKGTERVKQFSWEKAAKSFQRIIEENY